LQMVQNYLLGNLLTSMDGAFNVADVIRNMVLEEMPFEDFDRMVQVVKTIQPETLRSLAQKYFQKDQLWELIVGA
ncbi:MAG: hypothetical protein AAGD05_14895, partial [Bacteroidota bacterium]